MDALRAEGHEVESVHTLCLQGLDNGALYQIARDCFDLCFTCDLGFAHSVRGDALPVALKLLHVTLQQKPPDAFVVDFVSAFALAMGPSSNTPTIGRDAIPATLDDFLPL